MVLHSADFLIVLVSFAGNHDHVALLGKLSRGADGLATVGDAQHALRSSRKPLYHIVEDVVGILEAWVAEVSINLSLSREASFAMIGRLPRSRFPPAPTTVIILPRVPTTSRTVESTLTKASGVWHSRRLPCSRAATQSLESSGNRHQPAHVDQCVLLVETEQASGSVDGKQVVGVESSGEQHLHFVAVNVEQRSVERLSMILQRKSACERSEYVYFFAAVFCSMNCPALSSAFTRAKASAGRMSKNRFSPSYMHRQSCGSRGGRASGW